MKTMYPKENDKNGVCVPAKYSKIMAEEDKIHLVSGKDSVLIVGFLGVGLVGNIVTSELIEQLKMEEIGFVVTDDLPAIAIFYDGILKHPFRIYYSKDANIIIAQCEVPFNRTESYVDLARLLTGWALNIGIKELCCIQGLAAGGIPLETPVYVAAEKHIINYLVEKSKVEVLPRGLIMGPEAALLNECLNNRIDGYALLVPVAADLPSPDGAAAIIEKLNLIYDLKVDATKLREEGQKIKNKLIELNKKTQEQHSQLMMRAKERPASFYL